MRKNKKSHRTARNLNLPSWLKLRMDDSLKTQAKWMMERATDVNAGSMSIAVELKHRPWKVILMVKRSDI